MESMNKTDSCRFHLNVSLLKVTQIRINLQNSFSFHIENQIKSVLESILNVQYCTFYHKI